MTWSIIARDPATGAFGIAVATRFFAVGALCPHIRAGRGAFATQALINPTFGPDGLALLDRGADAAGLVATLLDADPGRATRQLHAVDAAGRAVGHTGEACIDWCGQFLGDNLSIAGNMLVGPAVLAETQRAYEDGADLPLAERLIGALEAGEAAGGDKRGRQSAALRIHTTEDYPALDLRVDDHPDPLAELRRLYQVSRERFQVFARFLATRAKPGGTWDRAVIEAAIAAETRA